MEEENNKNKEIRINLSTCLLLVVIVIIITIVISFLVFNRMQLNKKDLSLYNSVEISSVENLNNYNTKEQTNESYVGINQDSNEQIKQYSLEELVDVIYAQDFYKDVIDEFDSIEKTTQDYLFGVANKSLLLNRKDKDAMNLKYEDFNDELIRIFGEKADGLLKKENISKYEYDYNEDTDTYSIIGRDGAENDIRAFIIANTSEEENSYSVTIYEYIWKSVDSNGNLEFIDGASNIWICGLDGKTLLDFNVKQEEGFDGEYKYTTYNIYDSENNLIDNLKDYLMEHVDRLKDKRTINIEYDKESDRYIVISNKIIK